MSLFSHGGDIYTNQNVIDFSANINPFGTPERVKEAAKRSIENINHYPDVRCGKLISALAEKEETLESNLICGNGAAELIFHLCFALKPQKALITAPAFSEYEQALRAVDCNIEYIYLKEENGFHLTEDCFHYINDDLDLFFLCNPNNPTGELIPKDLLLKILERCKKHQVLLIVDECFNDFLDFPEEATLKDSIEEYSNLFLLKAFTKIYAMAGLRLGYGITSNTDLLKRMREISQPWNISIPAQEAGVVALKEEDYVKESKELIKIQRTYLVKELTELNYKVYGSKANYIFFHSDRPIFDGLRERNILIRDCSNYRGLDCNHENYFYRIAVRTKKENRFLIDELRQITKIEREN